MALVHLVMFDIDGTLIESNEFDSECFRAAVEDVLQVAIDTNWDKYHHATDAGILSQIMDELKLADERQSLFAAVKERYLHHISSYISGHKVSPIGGAPEFLARLARRPDVRVALATGGWLEPAVLKLEAAGLGVAGIPMASSSDHFSRIEIMRIAEARCGADQYQSKTYFGDGPWDLKASRALGYSFVLVGDFIDHEPSIQDYTAIDGVMSRLGL